MACQATDGNFCNHRWVKQHCFHSTLVTFLVAMQSGSNEHAALQEAVAELQEEPKELTSLYNDYAAPFKQWALGLELVALANYNDPVYIRQLWDVHLRQANISEHLYVWSSVLKMYQHLWL